MHKPFRLNPLRPAGAAILCVLATGGNALAASNAQAGAGIVQLVPLILIMVIFYFLLIRPQQKRLKEHKNMVASLKKGDRVITGGGIYGTITEVKDDYVRLEIANGVRVKVKADTIASLEVPAPAKS